MQLLEDQDVSFIAEILDFEQFLSQEEIVHVYSVLNKTKSTTPLRDVQSQFSFRECCGLSAAWYEYLSEMESDHGVS